MLGLVCLPAMAVELERRGDAYVVSLSSDLDFEDVVAQVHSEVIGENWSVVHVQDIGASMAGYGKQLDNRVISVCKSQYLAQAIEEDPFVSLIIPCRFTVFREPTEDGSLGRIVVGFFDPSAEAKAIELKQAQAADVATNELKAILIRVAEAFKE